MQAIMESLFDVAYLLCILWMGRSMVVRPKNAMYRLFGTAALVLGLGDAFHLVPRIFSLLTDTMEINTAALGIGKLVTSITMTAFYVLLYHFWRLRYSVGEQKGLTLLVYGLAAVRVALCLFPQNGWTSADPSFLWGILRNIPFALLGILIIILFCRQARQQNDRAFKLAWLAVSLSFAFYIPVVLWADRWPIVGMLMLPKTVCYVWLVLMGYREWKRA